MEDIPQIDFSFVAEILPRLAMGISDYNAMRRMAGTGKQGIEKAKGEVGML